MAGRLEAVRWVGQPEAEIPIANWGAFPDGLRGACPELVERPVLSKAEGLNPSYKTEERHRPAWRLFAHLDGT